MNQYVRTNKHKDFSYNEWAKRWINTYEQLIMKKTLIAMNEYKKTNKYSVEVDLVFQPWRLIERQNTIDVGEAQSQFQVQL